LFIKNENQQSPSKNLFFIMNISEVKIYPFDFGESGSSLRAYADVALDQSILIKVFRALSAKNGGLFVGFSSKKGKDGKFDDLIEFKSSDLQSSLRSAILEAYKVYF
jgi:DNA-binding cell septation regulator SpoVG